MDKPETPTTPTTPTHDTSDATPGNSSATAESSTSTNDDTPTPTPIPSIKPTTPRQSPPAQPQRTSPHRQRHSPYRHARPSQKQPLKLPRLLPKNTPHPHFTHLLFRLQPLISIETGRPHPSFPLPILGYHLLSHADLDALAAHYHQSSPSKYSLGYPATVVGRWGAKDGEVVQRDQHFEVLMEEARAVWAGVGGNGVGGGGGGMDMQAKEEERQLVEDKRRRFGRFLGFRACESPGIEDQAVMSEAMDLWLKGEVERRMQAEREREKLWGKRGW